MAIIATRINNSGTYLVNGSFDEITTSTIRTTTNTVYASFLDEVTYNSSSTFAKREGSTGIVYVTDQFDEFTGAPIVDSSLKLWLDAGQSSSYTGSGTAWYDISGNNNTGTLTNGPTYSSTTGGGSIIFDGVDDYTTISGYKGVTGTDPRTTIIWFKAITLNTPQRLIAWGTNTTSLKYCIRSHDSSPWSLRCEINGSNIFGGATAPNIVDGNWHMLSVVNPSNSALSQILLYVDSTLITDIDPTSANTGTIVNTDSGTDVSIGHSIADALPTQYTNGYIPAVLIYNRELTADEIAQNFNALRRRYGI